MIANFPLFSAEIAYSIRLLIWIKIGMNKNNDMLRNFFVWILIFTFALFIFDYFGNIQAASGRIAFSEFLQQVDAGQVSEVVIRGDNIEGKYSDGKRFSTMVANYPGLVDRLVGHGVKFEVSSTESTLGTFFGIILSWFPLLLLLGVWIFFMRQMQGGAGKAMGFGKSRARMLSDKNNTVTFADVAGIEEAKTDLMELVDFLRDPNKYQKLGGKIPKGCLLVGSPGTGNHKFRCDSNCGN